MSRRPLVLGLVAAVLATVGCSALPAYPRFVLSQLAALVLVSLGLNLLMGVAGLLSLASAAFVGVGANVAVVIMIRSGASILVATVGAIVAGAIIGWLLGLVSLRLSGFYLAVVTLGFLEVFVTLLKQGGDLTGGSYGLVLPVVSLPVLGDLSSDDLAIASVFLAVLAAALVVTITRSRVGRAWAAIKGNPVAAEMAGINIARYRTLAFAISSALASLGGAMQAFTLGITHPEAYDVIYSINHISYVVVGGMGWSVLGPILGPSVLFLTPQFLQGLGEWESIALALVMLGVLVVAPMGLAGLFHAGTSKLKARIHG